MAVLEFQLDVFTGPLDVLLYLISKHKLNINDIPIFELVEQYIAYVREMQEADMDIASEFIEMAARLIYIKTVSLLPVYEEAQKLKEELTGELLEYRDCKLMAEKLSKQANGFDYYERKPMELPVNHTYSRLHDSSELLLAYLNAVGRDRRKLPPPMEAFQVIVKQKIVSVNTGIVSIYRKLLKQSRLRFSALFEGASSRSQIVATFLAVLELVKANKVLLSDDNEQVTLNRNRGEQT